MFRTSKVLPSISLFWAGTCLAQIVWSVAFAQEVQWLALTCMLLILATLAAVCVRVSMHEASVPEFWLLKGPFFLQLGWICAASVVNFNVVIDAVTPTLKGTGSLLANGTIIDGDGVLNPDYFNDTNATVLLA